MIRFLILSFFLINLSSAFFLVSLVVSIYCIFLLLGKTNSPPKQLSVSSWVIPDFKWVISVILLSQIGTSSLLMSLSLRFLLLLHYTTSSCFGCLSYLSCLIISRFPFFTYGCRDSTTSGLHSPSSSSNWASC